jgi:hypothetical protein
MGVMVVPTNLPKYKNRYRLKLPPAHTARAGPIPSTEPERKTKTTRTTARPPPAARRPLGRLARPLLHGALIVLKRCVVCTDFRSPREICSESCWRASRDRPKIDAEEQPRKAIEARDRRENRDPDGDGRNSENTL